MKKRIKLKDILLNEQVPGMGSSYFMDFGTWVADQYTDSADEARASNRAYNAYFENRPAWVKAYDNSTCSFPIELEGYKSETSATGVADKYGPVSSVTNDTGKEFYTLIENGGKTLPEHRTGEMANLIVYLLALNKDITGKQISFYSPPPTIKSDKWKQGCFDILKKMDREVYCRVKNGKVEWNNRSLQNKLDGYNPNFDLEECMKPKYRKSYVYYKKSDWYILPSGQYEVDSAVRGPNLQNVEELKKYLPGRNQFKYSGCFGEYSAELRTTSWESKMNILNKVDSIGTMKVLNSSETQKECRNKRLVGNKKEIKFNYIASHVKHDSVLFKLRSGNYIAINIFDDWHFVQIKT